MPYTPLQGSFKQAKRAEAAGRLRGYRRRLRQSKERAHRGPAAKAAAENTHAEKGHALAAICHELQAPLKAITRWARVARTAAPAGGAELGDALARIESSARLQAALINDMFDLLKSADGMLGIERHAVDPSSSRRAASGERGS